MVELACERNVHNEMRFIECCRRYSKLKHFPVNNANIRSPDCSKRKGCGCREGGRTNTRSLSIVQNIDTCTHWDPNPCWLIHRPRLSLNVCVSPSLCLPFTHRINIAVRTSDQLGLVCLVYFVVEFVSMSSHSVSHTHTYYMYMFTNSHVKFHRQFAINVDIFILNGNQSISGWILPFSISLNFLNGTNRSAFSRLHVPLQI